MSKPIKSNKTKNDKSKQNKENVLSPFDQQLLDDMKIVRTYKLSAEANIVSILYHTPETLFNFDLKLEDFTNNAWKVYFAIVHDLIIKEKKQVLDEITVGLYLEKHPKLKSKYEEYGGYNTIENAKAYIKVENMTGYIKELKKWNVVIELIKMGFPVHDKLSQFVDMEAEDIYSLFEAKLNHVFLNVDNDVKSYDICDGLDELIDELDAGLGVGLPFYDLPTLNKETGGMLEGNITLVGGLSNVGKSTFARSTMIPSILKYNEKAVFMLNEDGRKKWQREMLVYIANNILKKTLPKYTVRDGKFTEETKDILKKCADWLREKAKNHTITLIPFEKYSTPQAIKIIKKFAAMGIKYFCLDTFKMDSGKVSEQSWLQLQQNMTDIYDVVKPESKNLHIFITFQLGKQSSKQRYYSQDNIGGGGKNIIDCASTCIMIRNVLEDEMKGGKKPLYVYRMEGKNKLSKIPVELDPNKKYQILFIVKNREGGTTYQIVVEHDMSRNVMKEVGITHVEVDF